MLNCFAKPSEQPSIPIIPIVEKQLDEWVQAQQTRVQNWVQSTYFRAKSGNVGLLCDVQGKLEKVLVGMSNPQDLAVFGLLATQLPKGNYHIGVEYAAPQNYHAYLAWGLASYQFTPYKKFPALEAKLILAEQGLDTSYLEAVLRATYLVRDLINTPAEDMTPADIAEAAMELADEFGARVNKVIGDDLLKEGYPTIYAVGKGSPHAPHFIDLRWGEAHHPKVTLVGKGISFDTGGLDIKNAAGMSLMKKDMAGAAHVLGLARVVMALKLPINLRVLIAAAENAVSGEAYHPGDVIVTRKGLSVEVTNTDAEGRLVLCDALAEAVTEKPELLLDFASLTGAARVALGTEVSAMFTADDHLAQGLMECAQKENDPLWRLPLHTPYRKLLDSKIADITNASSSAYGGAITAALFLKEFVPDEIVWAHFDIMAWNVAGKMGLSEGGEATALRATAAYLCQRFGRL